MAVHSELYSSLIIYQNFASLLPAWILQKSQPKKCKLACSASELDASQRKTMSAKSLFALVMSGVHPIDSAVITCTGKMSQSGYTNKMSQSGLTVPTVDSRRCLGGGACPKAGPK
jgi:hypothetical protein